MEDLTVANFSTNSGVSAASYAMSTMVSSILPDMSNVSTMDRFTNCSFLYQPGISPNATNMCPSDPPPDDNNLMYSIMMAFYTVVFAVGLTGNTLVIYVVLRYSKMQTVTNMYILNLALADEFFLIGVPILIATITVRRWIFGRTVCKLYMTSTSITQFTSSIFLTVMSADRYIAVCHPISSPKYRTPFISRVVCLTAWTVSALMMVPIFMYADVLPPPNVSCNILWPSSDQLDSLTPFTLYSLILGFSVPISFISVFYALVVKKLKTVGPRNKSKEKKKSHRKVTKLVLTVIAVYVACWLPYWIAQVALIFSLPGGNKPTSTVLFFLATGFLTYSNSALNPILYAFLSENFKKSFIKACVCAARKDVTPHLQVENSVFPRKTKAGSERLKSKELESEDDPNDMEPSTAITMTSRSNNVPSAVLCCSEKYPMLGGCRNGYHKPTDVVALTTTEHQPTQV